MRFVGLILEDFVPYKDSGIQKFHATFESDVTVIVGTNGSGKSQTMALLDPQPVAKSMFGSKGYRCNLVDVDGTLFKLESDYTRSTSPHFLFEGESDLSLNESGNTQIQKDLIIEHLKMTPFISDIIMDRIDLPQWKPADRKEFLMKNNPQDIGFLFTAAKKMTSSIRACKNNLSHLQSRKITLEQDMLSAENLQALREEKDQIDKDLSFFQEQLLKIEIASQVITTHRAAPGVQSIPYDQWKARLQQIRAQLRGMTDIERDDTSRAQQTQRLISERDVVIRKISDNSTAIENHTLALNDLELRYKEIAPSADLADIEMTISQLEAARVKLDISKPVFVVTKHDLAQGYALCDVLHEELMLFQHCEVPLLPSSKRRLRERTLRYAEHRLSSYQMQLHELENHLEELSKRNTMSPSDIPTDNCAKDRCPLYRHFMGTYATVEEQRQSTRKKIARLTWRVKRVSQFAEAAQTYFRLSNPYHNKINDIVQRARSNPVLYNVLKGLDILYVFKYNPNQIVIKLRQAYDHIEQWLRLQDVLSDLDTAKALRERCLGAENSDTVRLIVDIENTKRTIRSLQQEIAELNPQLDLINTQHLRLVQFGRLKEEVLEYQRLFMVFREYAENQHELSRLKLLKDTIESLRQKAFLRMSEVERILRSQNTLQERYTEEVVKQIDEITQALRDQEQIEKALLGIPKDITIDFINGIFEHANRLLDAIWTVPFSIDLIDPNDPLTYAFTVSGDNDSVREMNVCSKGQKDILKLVLNLALRIELKLFNLPLCLDEVGASLDDRHRQNMVMVLKGLIDDNVISQLFLISHHVVIHEGLNNVDTIVLREDNIVRPEQYNLNCTIT